MAQISTAGLTSNKGEAIIYDPSGLWKEWAMHEVYLGPDDSGNGRYVPKILDYINDVQSNTKYIVDDLDPTTLIPVLRRVKTSTDIGLSDEDILLGVGPGVRDDTYRVYLDTSVIPHILATDQRYHVNGTASVKAKVFRGTVELGSSQKVISAFFDPSGNLLGEDIPLELVKEEGNKTVKQVPPCYTMENMPDNEPVTVVIYGAGNNVLSKRAMLIENTGFIRSPGSNKKYITGIRLKSPWMSKSNPNQLDYPLNLLTQAMQLTGQVLYSDGSNLEMPVDGTKFTLHGLDSFVSTIVGQKVGLVLTYHLSEDEVCYDVQLGEQRHKSEMYTAETKPREGAYTVKLFGYPVWIDAVHGYRMEWFLYNLDRQQVFKVTPYVKFNANTAVFDPLLYGVKQALSVSVNLKDVNGAFNSWTHTQTIDISLTAPGTARQTNWTIAFDPAQDPQFGKDNAARTTFVNSNQYTVAIDLGAASQEAWLERLYRRTKPLFDPSREVEAPAPTHFALLLGDREVVYPISSWRTRLTVDYPLNNNATLFVKFIKRTVDNDIQLAVAGLPIYQSN